MAGGVGRWCLAATQASIHSLRVSAMIVSVRNPGTPSANLARDVCPIFAAAGIYSVHSPG